MISEHLMKKYFDRWTNSSYGDDVVTTSIGYNYIDNQEDYEMQLWYLEDPTKKNEEQKKLGLGIYSLSMRKDSVTVTEEDLKNHAELIEGDDHFSYYTDSFINLMIILRKFYPDSVDELKLVKGDSFIEQMSNILQNFCTQNNLPQYDPDDLLYGEYEGKRISLTRKQRSFLYDYKDLWNEGEV